MIKSIFKIAYRNLLRNKSFSIINISGLAIGMASAMLILLWVKNELSYDNFYPNKKRLYQAWYKDKGNDGINVGNVTTKMLAPALKQEFPEVEKSARFFWDEVFLFSVGEKKMNISGNMTDPDFLTMFSFPLLQGDVNTALNNPYDIVITQKLSKKLFGDENAMGKTIRVDNKYDFRVSAVMKDLPVNTQFTFEYLLPWSHMKTTSQDDSCWGCGSSRNYVMLKQNTSIDAVNDKIKGIVKKHAGPEISGEVFLYPVSKLRLYSNFENGQPAGGKIEMVKIFSLIAVFILLIACINFMNMSTARSEKRAKEVGIRKVAGAQKGSLIGQFLGESILVACIAGAVALLLVHLCLPGFSSFTSKQLVVNTTTSSQLEIEYGNVYFWILFAGFILFTGIIAGSYPAFFLSSFRPVAVLKGSFKKVHALVTPRKVLVILQFTFSIILIISTIVIQRQVKYSQERATGYDKNNLVYIPLSGDIDKNFELIKNDLISKGIAASVTKTSAPITEGWSSGEARWAGKDPNDKTEFNYYNTTGNIAATAGLQLVQGRDIDLKIYPTDSTAVILNESAVKAMGLKDPIGQLINHGTWDADWHVVGVVKDFILQSPYEPIKPMVIQGPRANWFNVIHVKFTGKNSTAQHVADMEKVFKLYNPDYPFDYHFVDERYDTKFSNEKTTATLTAFFAALTIFISCLGLFGLAAYMAENRIKEIGVRKVLGASVAGITALLSKDFVKLVFISIIIASPVAWWAMNKWLSGYNYHTNISWWIFFIAGVLSLLIALFTVSFQAIKAAITNPAKSLRTE
jgi:ABC-type antimicrobial peptide transport system permease subunit